MSQQTNFTLACPYGKTLQLEAPVSVTDTGGIQYNFVNWTVDGTPFTSNPLNLTIVADTIVVAVYTSPSTPNNNTLALLILLGIGAVFS
jgi:hypothetical protein